MLLSLRKKMMMGQGSLRLEMSADEKFTEKQEKFCHEYIIDMNGTKAAIRAGYSERGADVQAANLLRKIRVREKIDELKRKACKRNDIHVDRVLQEFARLAFLNPALLFDENGDLIPIQKLDEDVARAIGAFDVTEVRIHRDGEDTKYEQVKKFKLSDKIRALDSLAKYLEMFKDKESSSSDKLVELIGGIVNRAEQHASRVENSLNSDGDDVKAL
ncbi:MAG: terminase small subunit [Gammaproteobacteria bacterium]|nr:terminase small subunit [Gammaproteobacteria bacterium]